MALTVPPSLDGMRDEVTPNRIAVILKVLTSAL